jgi:hypothetical protein
VPGGIPPSGYAAGMTDSHRSDPAIPRNDGAADQDAEPTMTAPPEDRPDADASVLEPGGRADNPDVVDADDEP